MKKVNDSPMPSRKGSQIKIGSEKIRKTVTINESNMSMLEMIELVNDEMGEDTTPSKRLKPILQSSMKRGKESN